MNDSTSSTITFNASIPKHLVFVIVLLLFAIACIPETNQRDPYLGYFGWVGTGVLSILSVLVALQGLLRTHVLRLTKEGFEWGSGMGKFHRRWNDIEEFSTSGYPLIRFSYSQYYDGNANEGIIPNVFSERTMRICETLETWRKVNSTMAANKTIESDT